MTGRGSFHLGLAAEEIAERHYIAEGGKLLARRWISPAGEIDLIFALGDATVFVEVKARASHEEAAAAITLRQWRRISGAAILFMDEAGRNGAHMRIDAALIDGQGRLQIVENATMGE